MGKTILFSPVGGTDPISETNLRDGSLLHISRVYKPDEVVLYLSDEMLEKHRKDNRYAACIEKLAEMQNRLVHYKIFERPGLVNVQSFDVFYSDFAGIIRGIVNEMNEDDRLLINISSGTPAMKSSLVVLGTLGEYSMTMIQVLTPTRKMNQHHHSSTYDLEELWELNEDNAADFENRCEEIVCPTLSDMMKKEIIRKHVLVYDYQAALDVAETLSNKPEKLMNALKMSVDRYLMKRSVDYYMKEGVKFSLPVQNSKYRDYFEYALVMMLKLKRGEYADYIRAITPLIMDLFELVLEKQCQLRLADYCEDRIKRNNPVSGNMKKKRMVKMWDRKKLEGTRVLDVLNEAYVSGFEYSWVKSDHLRYIIDAYVDDEKLKKLITNIRDAENAIRNLAAHEIMSITDDTIMELTGFSGTKIMQMIQQLFSYTDIKAKSEFWNSYDDMNSMIIGLLD